MKAPTKVDKFLIANGFTYRRPYYQRLSRRVPLMECLNFSKHKPGLMLLQRPVTTNACCNISTSCLRAVTDPGSTW